MFNIDDVIRGYSDRDEFVARDLMLIELLVEAGVLQVKDVNEKFTAENLRSHIKQIQEETKKQREDTLKEMEKDGLIHRS